MVDETIVEEILQYTPADYVYDRDRLDYCNLEYELENINPKSEPDKYGRFVARIVALNDKAEAAFVAKYKSYAAELQEAFTRSATQVIIHDRNILESILEDHSMTIAEAVDNEDLPNDIADALQAFNDNILQSYIWMQNAHITKSQELREILGQSISGILSALIAKKWTLEADTESTNAPTYTIKPNRFVTATHITSTAVGNPLVKAPSVNVGFVDLNVGGGTTSQIALDCSIFAPSIRERYFPNNSLLPEHYIVADAVYRLYLMDQSTFTVKDILNNMLGFAKNKAVTPTAKQSGIITDAMDALSMLIVRYRGANELARKLVTTATSRANFFECRERSVCYPNGKVGHEYVLDAEPILLEIARLTKQLLSYPKECAEISSHMTLEKSCGLRYLLQRVLRMKGNSDKYDVIKVDSLIAESTLTPTKRMGNKRITLCNFFEQDVMEHWKDTGWITNYESLDANKRRIGEGQRKGTKATSKLFYYKIDPGESKQ